MNLRKLCRFIIYDVSRYRTSQLGAGCDKLYSSVNKINLRALSICICREEVSVFPVLPVVAAVRGGVGGVVGVAVGSSVSLLLRNLTARLQTHRPVWIESAPPNRSLSSLFLYISFTPLSPREEVSQLTIHHDPLVLCSSIGSGCFLEVINLGMLIFFVSLGATGCVITMLSELRKKRVLAIAIVDSVQFFLLQTFSCKFPGERVCHWS